MRERELQRTMLGAPSRYKTYLIKKRSGGVRRIAQPAREVKFLQRALIKVLLDELPIHAAATAYRSGLSIRDNATPHANNGPILKLDFRDFFPSIRSRDWIEYCKNNGVMDDQDSRITAHLLFYRPKGTSIYQMAIGAPSSPILSNILMNEFDEKVTASIFKDNVTYTRYADDMTFSAPRTGHLTGVMSAVSKIIRSMKSPSLELNGDKTTYATMKYHRSVTGLTLANDGRVTIGRDRKRLVSATVHRALFGKLNAQELQVLAGVLAYINAVEPEFLQWLKDRYGAPIVKEIQVAVSRNGRLPVHRPPIAPS